MELDHEDNLAWHVCEIMYGYYGEKSSRETCQSLLDVGRVNNNLKLFVTYLTDRFYDAMNLFGNKTQMMSKYGENIEVMS